MAKKEVIVQSTGGVGFLGLLALVFITLKLIGVITWSWAWVLAPIWIPIVLVCAFLLAGLLFIIGKHLYDEHKRKKKVAERKK